MVTVPIGKTLRLDLMESVLSIDLDENHRNSTMPIQVICRSHWITSADESFDSI